MTDPNRLPMKNNRVTHATRIHKKKPSLSDGSNSSKAQLTKRIKIKHKNLLLKLDQDLDQRTNVTIGRMDERLLADYVAQSTRRFETNLSPLELQDLYIPGKIMKRNVALVRRKTEKAHRECLSKHQWMDRLKST